MFILIFLDLRFPLQSCRLKLIKFLSFLKQIIFVRNNVTVYDDTDKCKCTINVAALEALYGGFYGTTTFVPENTFNRCFLRVIDLLVFQ